MKTFTASLFTLICICLLNTACSQVDQSTNEAPLKSSLLHVEDSTFQTEVLESKTPVLVDFYTDWCGPCKTIAPRVEQVAQNNSEKLKVVKLNTDKSPAIAQKYEIKGIPTLILFKDGAEVDRVVGLVKRPKIQALVDKGI